MRKYPSSSPESGLGPVLPLQPSGGLPGPPSTVPGTLYIILYLLCPNSQLFSSTPAGELAPDLQFDDGSVPAGEEDAQGDPDDSNTILFNLQPKRG